MIQNVHAQIDSFFNMQIEHEEKKEQLAENIKAKAELALRNNDVYEWEFYVDDVWKITPETKNVVEFMRAHETGDFTLHNMLVDILDNCNGKDSKNSKCIAIDYMSSVIAELEVEAWVNEG